MVSIAVHGGPTPHDVLHDAVDWGRVVVATLARGIVATLAAKIHGFDANIEKISVEEKDARYTVVQLEIGVQNRVHLARIMRRLRTIKSVQRVFRFKNTRSKTLSPIKRPEQSRKTQRE